MKKKGDCWVTAVKMNIGAKSMDTYIRAIEEVIHRWSREGIPPRWTLVEDLKKLIQLKKSLDVSSVMPVPFRLITATLDDGWGLGIEIIHHACDVLGIHYIFLGLMKSANEIAQACESENPDAVGVTVLQDDTVEELLLLRRLLPVQTELFAGGPGIREFKPPAGVLILNNIIDFMSHFVGRVRSGKN